MLIPVIVFLSLSQLIISGETIIHVLRARSGKSQVERRYLAVFLLSSSPNFFMSIKSLLILLNVDVPYDLIFVYYGISVIFTYIGFSINAGKMFEIANKIAGGFNYWKQWIGILVPFFIIFTPVIAVNMVPLEFIEGQMVYKTMAINDVTFGTVSILITAAVFSPFIFRFSALNLKNKSKTGKINGILILLFYELLGFTVFYGALFANTLETITNEFLLQNSCAFLLLIIFRHPNTIESWLMQLNIESVHIATNDGSILRSVVFTSGKFSQGNDQFLGNLMKAMDLAVTHILGNDTFGLQHIILDDGTIFMMERSNKLDLVYIVCTRSFSQYARKKINELRVILDDRLAPIETLDRNTVEAEITPDSILNVFL